MPRSARSGGTSEVSMSRHTEMKRFAGELSLTYKRSDLAWFKYFFLAPFTGDLESRTNIMSGSLDGKEVNIYDYYFYVPSTYPPRGVRKRRTYINGKFYKYKLSPGSIKLVLERNDTPPIEGTFNTRLFGEAFLWGLFLSIILSSATLRELSPFYNLFVVGISISISFLVALYFGNKGWD